jgi:O-antigen ligase
MESTIFLMSRETINELVAGGAGVIGLVLYAGLILRPAVGAYSRMWERLAASLLSLYVLAVLVGVGVSGALAAVYFWD